MTVRTPSTHTTMAYGAPSFPAPEEVVPDFESIARFIPFPKRKLRVSTRREENGELKLKIYVDDVLVCEATSENGTTITMETTV